VNWVQRFNACMHLPFPANRTALYSCANAVVVFSEEAAETYDGLLWRCAANRPPKFSP
jgi:hypothetical protein